MQVTAIMLNVDEAKRNLGLPMHGLLINGGMSHVSMQSFSSVAWHSIILASSACAALHFRIPEHILGALFPFAGVEIDQNAGNEAHNAFTASLALLQSLRPRLAVLAGCWPVHATRSGTGSPEHSSKLGLCRVSAV